jgi:hypothetical protein
MARANGQPVAMMKTSRCVACPLPEKASLQGAIARTRARTQPILAYLKNK